MDLYLGDTPRPPPLRLAKGKRRGLAPLDSPLFSNLLDAYASPVTLGKILVARKALWEKGHRGSAVSDTVKKACVAQDAWYLFLGYPPSGLC